MISDSFQKRLSRRDARSPLAAPLRALLVGISLVGLVGAPQVAAEEASKQQMQSLDEQVQEIKSEVLSIAAELSRLEEKLLYPSNTQVAVFVSLADGETMELDSVRIAIDGEPVAHHIYSFKELQALQKGGVQRIFTGNVTTGTHQIEVTVAGKNATGGDFGGTQSFAFQKEAEPEIISVNLSGGDFGDASVEIGGL